MGTQVTHEPPNPDLGDSLENSQTPPNDSGSTSQTTQPTVPPTSGPTEEQKYIALLEGTLRTTNQRLAAIEQNVNNPPPPPPPPRSADELRAEFYENPQDATRKLIREELESSVGEIREFVRSFKGQSAIDGFMNTAKVDPRFSAMWDQSVENYVREQAGQIPPKNLNEQTFNFIVISAIGLKATGMLGSAPAPTSNPPAPPANAPAPAAPAGSQPAPTPSMPTPPHMRPSPPPTQPTPTNQPSHRPLDENEKRLLREYNAGKPPEKKMTEAQFIQWQQMPSADVAFSDLGKPAPRT